MAVNPNKKPAPEPIEHAYNIGQLNVIFAIFAIVLVATTVFSVWDDFNRPWKTVQRDYIRRDRAKAEEDRQKAQASLSQAEIDALASQLATAEAEMRQNHEAMTAAEKKLTKLLAEQYKIDQDYKFAKADLDSIKYRVEQALFKQPKVEAEEAKSRYDKRLQEWREHGAKLETVSAQVAAAEAEILQYTSKVTAIETQRADLMKNVDLIEKRIALLREDVDFNLLNNVPLLDFVSPTIKVQQVVLDDLLIDINFMRISRVDRCQTCHLAIDRKGWEGERQPFAAHPRLDLFVGSSSPHPVATFGCTVCHKGRDRALEFGRAGHEPDDSVELVSWEENHQYHPDHFNEEPMLPAKFSAAGCWQCHKSGVRVYEAPKLDKGISLVEQMGCWGCHQIKGLEGMRKVGPDLSKLASKVSPDWTYWWIQNPKDFRSATKMPRFFHLTNSFTEADHVRNDTEVAAITSYLYKVSEPAVALPPPPMAGTASTGKVLFDTIGCKGCHMIEADAKPDFSETHRQHGPNLAGTGSKTSAAWVYHWIKDPKKWWPETNMPDLRLSVQESADLTAYLMEQRNPVFEKKMTKARPVDEAALEELALWGLSATLPRSQADAAYAKMPAEERLNFVGEKIIARYGCFGCHDIKGFENAKRIGTELTAEGSKSPHLLDFGFVNIPHTREAWFHNKLADPRIYDLDKVKDYDEKLKMPLFNLTEEGKQQVTTALLGFVRDSLRPGRAAVADPDIAAGRRLLQQKNCQGCHRIEKHGGDIRDTLDDTAMAPPFIENEGERVQTGWLSNFLADPSRATIRPWLKVRMPTFHFTDTELNTVLRYFAALDRAKFPYTSEYRVTPGSRNVILGRAVFQTLRCFQCHPSQFVPGQAKSTELAPNLALSAHRLRADWVPHWIEEPEVRIPGTRMPTNFPAGENGRRTSPLAGVLDSPVFAAERPQFVAQFGGDAAAARAWLSDIDAITRALRDYIWTLGGGTAKPGESASRAAVPSAAEAAP